MISESLVGRIPSARPPSRILLSRAGQVPSSHLGFHTAIPMTTDGMFRMPKDKRYYMHTIKSHMNLIRDELVRLQRKTAIYRTTGNQTAFRKMAESAAQNYSENQENLTTYNLVLEIQASQDKYVKLVYETNLLKEKNKQCLTDLDNLISAKLLREDSITGLKKEIEEEQRHVQELINSLSDEDKSQYKDFYNANKVVLPRIKTIDDELRTYRESYKQIKKTINKISNKQKYLIIFQSLNKSKKHKETLELENQQLLTPAQQRQNLIQQVRTNKTDTESLLNILKLLEQDYQSKEERLEILKFQLSENNAKHLKKHKELRQREILINSFNSTFLEKSTSLVTKLKTAKNEILLLLQTSAKSIADLNFEELDNIQLNLNQSSEADMKDRINLFKLRLTRLHDCKIKYQTDIKTMKQKNISLQQDLKKFENPVKVKEDLETNYQSQTYKRDELCQMLMTTESAVVEAERVQAELNPQLYDNNVYKEVQYLEKELETVDNEIQETKSLLSVIQVKEAISNKLRDIDSLVLLKNEQIIKYIRVKKPKMIETTS